MKTGFWMKESNNSKSFVMALVAALLLVMQMGCGGGGGGSLTGVSQSADEQAIYTLVDRLSSKAGEDDARAALAELRQSFFSKDNAPSASQLQGYKENYFEVSDKINISGDSASFTVSVGNYASGAVVEKPWKAVREGGVWKLSETPL